MEFKKLFKKSAAVAMTLAVGLSVAACEELGVPSYSTEQTAEPNGSTAETTKTDAEGDTLTLLSTDNSADNSAKETTAQETSRTSATDASPYKDYPVQLADEWKQDQDFTLADPAPWNLEELKQVVDVHDPRSVAAYWVWAITRLTDNYDDGMAMMKYLFADIEPFGSGFTEGGGAGQAGWDSYFNERLKDKTYRWLPRAYFNGASSDNGFVPDKPLTIELYYNDNNTETINSQTLDSLGRLNIVYWVQSYAAGNQVNIELSRFDGSDRWYVTKGASSSALFYQQSGAGTTAAQSLPNDESTQADHDAYYGK